MHNGNEATTNELGRTKRSSHKGNKSGKGRMGALRVKDIHTGVEFELGTGFTDADKEWWWDDSKLGLTVKYKFFPVGVKDKPRHPVYLGLRSPIDL
jgi:DNA ligase-1